MKLYYKTKNKVKERKTEFIEVTNGLMQHLENKTKRNATLQ